MSVISALEHAQQALRLDSPGAPGTISRYLVHLDELYERDMRAAASNPMPAPPEFLSRPSAVTPIRFGQFGSTASEAGDEGGEEGEAVEADGERAEYHDVRSGELGVRDAWERTQHAARALSHEQGRMAHAARSSLLRSRTLLPLNYVFRRTIRKFRQVHLQRAWRRWLEVADEWTPERQRAARARLREQLEAERALLRTQEEHAATEVRAKQQAVRVGQEEENARLAERYEGSSGNKLGYSIWRTAAHGAAWLAFDIQVRELLEAMLEKASDNVDRVVQETNAVQPPGTRAIFANNFVYLDVWSLARMCASESPDVAPPLGLDSIAIGAVLYERAAAGGPKSVAYLQVRSNVGGVDGGGVDGVGGVGEVDGGGDGDGDGDGGGGEQNDEDKDMAVLTAAQRSAIFAVTPTLMPLTFILRRTLRKYRVVHLTRAWQALRNAHAEYQRAVLAAKTSERSAAFVASYILNFYSSWAQRLKAYSTAENATSEAAREMNAAAAAAAAAVAVNDSSDLELSADFPGKIAAAQGKVHRTGLRRWLSAGKIAGKVHKDDAPQSTAEGNAEMGREEKAPEASGQPRRLHTLTAADDFGEVFGMIDIDGSRPQSDTASDDVGEMFEDESAAEGGYAEATAERVDRMNNVAVETPRDTFYRVREFYEAQKEVAEKEWMAALATAAAAAAETPNVAKNATEHTKEELAVTVTTNGRNTATAEGVGLEKKNMTAAVEVHTYYREREFYEAQKEVVEKASKAAAAAAMAAAVTAAAAAVATTAAAAATTPRQVAEQTVRLILADALKRAAAYEAMGVATDAADEEVAAHKNAAEHEAVAVGEGAARTLAAGPEAVVVVPVKALAPQEDVAAAKHAVVVELKDEEGGEEGL